MRYLLCLLLLLGATVHAADRNRVEGYELQNGLQVILKPTSERGHVAIRLVVGVGFDDFACRDKELPHLLEHLFFSGLDGEGEAGLEARMQALGGEWNAFTSTSDTAFVIEAPAQNQRKVLDLLLQVLGDTPLDDARIATAKQVVEREGAATTRTWSACWTSRISAARPTSSSPSNWAWPAPNGPRWRTCSARPWRPCAATGTRRTT